MKQCSKCSMKIHDTQTWWTEDGGICNDCKIDKLQKHVAELESLKSDWRTELTAWLQMALRWYCLHCTHKPHKRGIILTLKAMGETEEQAQATFKRLNKEYRKSYKCPKQAENTRFREALEEIAKIDPACKSELKIEDDCDLMKEIAKQALQGGE